MGFHEEWHRYLLQLAVLDKTIDLLLMMPVSNVTFQVVIRLPRRLPHPINGSARLARYDDTFESPFRSQIVQYSTFYSNQSGLHQNITALAH